MRVLPWLPKDRIVLRHVRPSLLSVSVLARRESKTGDLADPVSTPAVEGPGNGPEELRCISNSYACPSEYLHKRSVEFATGTIDVSVGNVLMHVENCTFCKLNFHTRRNA